MLKLVPEIAQKVNISNECIVNIMHEELSARWVPRLLTMDQKRTQVIILKQCLDKFEHNSSKFLRCYIAVDETVGNDGFLWFRWSSNLRPLDTRRKP